MNKKLITILGISGGIIILAVLWFVLDPLGTGGSNQVTEYQPPPPQSTTQPDSVQQIEEPIEVQKEEPSKTTRKPAKDISDEEIYVVKEGDTLQKIAVDYYGETKYWFLLFGANESEIDYWDFIYPGQELMIPSLEQKL